jgi:hypothetical protein
LVDGLKWVDLARGFPADATDDSHLGYFNSHSAFLDVENLIRGENLTPSIQRRMDNIRFQPAVLLARTIGLRLRPRLVIVAKAHLTCIAIRLNSPTSHCLTVSPK